MPGRAEEKSLGRGAGSDVRERLAQQRVEPAAPVGSAHSDDVEPQNRESAAFLQCAPLPRGVAVMSRHVCIEADGAVVCNAPSGSAARRIVDVSRKNDALKGPEGRASKIREKGLFEIAHQSVALPPRQFVAIPPHQPSSRESRPAIYVRISCPKAAMS